MGKHNGKARKSGLQVGAALANRSKVGTKSKAGQLNHTTDVGPGMQSVLDQNDLTEFMNMANLANKDFSAEKANQVIVISTGAMNAKDTERNREEREATERRNMHRLRVPRRPAWAPGTTPDELDANERAAFLAWRRELAEMEESEKLVLTPFEKNLEVWRQLWRVLERSDIVVQVIDAREPLRYRSLDLEAYSRELAPSKRSILLLNKSDLLPPEVRAAWADYFDAQGVQYVFWSAKSAADDPEGSAARKALAEPRRIRLLSVDELIDFLSSSARAARDEAAGTSGDDQAVSGSGQPQRVVVGLTGYPNVGKSSTINALFGSKKTAVAATPGKTKHFQTLNITEELTLCDCPGLVLPRFAASKAEMVAAGVIPIDRLTDVRAPVEVIAQRVPRPQLEAAYGCRLPAPALHEDPHRPPTAAEVLRAVAAARGWASASGLPDETRAGRLILKDYTSGKLVYCEWPPGMRPSAPALTLAPTAPLTPPPAAARAPDSAAHPFASDRLAAVEESESESEGSEEGPEAAGASGRAADQGERAAVGELSAADLDLMASMNLSSKPKPKRPEYKFNKKPVRTKGDRGREKEWGAAYDGSAFTVGKKGGLVRAPVAVPVPSK